MTGLIIDGVPIESPIGLIAGSGSSPLQFAAAARDAGLEVVAIAHVGETDPALEKSVAHCSWVKVGQLGTVIKIFKQHAVKNVALLGGINRPKLFGGAKPDMRALALLARLRSFKDDVLLRGVAEEIESEGIRIFSAHHLLPGSIPDPGYLTTRRLSASEAADAKIGWDAAELLGAADIGQTVIVNHRQIVAVEAIEGTDRCIERAHALSGGGAVIVKRCKPQQDRRLDLPAIGPGTVRAMQKAGATALVLEARRAIIIERPELITAADRHNLSILSAESPDQIG